MITAKIDITKIKGAKVLKKDGRTFLEITQSGLFEGKNGAVYVDLSIWETKDDKFGNDWRINQDLGKDARAAGEKGAILGNGKNRWGSAKTSTPLVPQQSFEDSSDVPF